MVQVEDLIKAAEPEEPCKSDKPTLLSKYRIPVQHLEFEYVEACNDGKELEKILHILKSGEEGYFPHLVEATEKRLAVLKPNSKLLRKVCPVLKSSEISKDEWDGLSQDLSKWVDDVNKKDQELEGRKIKLDVDVVDSDIRKTQDTCTTLAVKSNPKRIKSTDYESWDKYDPDTEILKMDLEDEKLKKEVLQMQEKQITNSKKVRFNNFATEAEAVFEANREKERGNECFKAGEYQTALQHYTNSLECKPLAVVYTNRALTYNKLKKYKMAIDDCKTAIKLEPKNFKAHLRAAQSYEALQQYVDALENVEIAIEIDPNNTVAQQLANRVRKQCGDTVITKRFSIQDVDSDNKFNSKPLKPILKSVENKSETKKQKSNATPIKDYEVISIPGGSKMPPPYYKVVHSSDPEIIKREKQKIFNRPRLLHITTIDVASDDEDQTNQNENEKPQTSKNSIKTKEQPPKAKVKKSLKKDELENLKFNDNKKIVEGKHQWNTNEHVRKPFQQINTQSEQSDNGGAGGEPCIDDQQEIIPTAEELQSPYAFIETWNSIRKDTSYKQHAEILRRLDYERMQEVIGYKLDDGMLSSIINCLHRHFMVPGELDRLHAILIKITYIPRFKMMLMFLGETDWRCIHQLIQFLDQHGRNLPSNINNIYINN